MTLMEVIVAMGVMAIMMAGVLAAFMQTRRLASASVGQNCAVTIVQGYVEQLKNIPLQAFVNADPEDAQNNPNLTHSFALPTMKDQTRAANASDPPPNRLMTTPSTVSLATLLGQPPGTTPTGAVDNLQTFDVDSRTAAGTTTWSAIWPTTTANPTTYPATDARYPNNPNLTPGKSDLHMNFWVQITDHSGATKFAESGV